ncbi:DUF983 domain-containing protein [Chachezhania sediminis]|uniref:DUF983 domain-containing protein n=1 Tax=Chachezhania sediminis TaxID=2599291 RepID=UPI00131BE907|nr:DUF983 domain-containing protein [Chachezhania sediminis]
MTPSDTQTLPARATSVRKETDRPTKPAMLRGWRRKCPRCGQGQIFKGYLAVNSACPVCKQDFTPQRADDGPAYLTILIVGHLMAPALLTVFVEFRPDPLVLFTIFAVGSVGLSLYLLPRLKGMMIGLQWARRMGGFGAEPDRAPEEWEDQ